MTESSLYERLGGAFAIAAVVDHFSEAVVRNPIAGQQSENAELREWSTNDLGRLPGLKFMRTLWVCDIAGGPQHYAATKPGSTPLGLEEAHRALKISPAIFDEVAAELGRSLDHFNVPEPEKGEVLAADTPAAPDMSRKCGKCDVRAAGGDGSIFEQDSERANSRSGQTSCRT